MSHSSAVAKTGASRPASGLRAAGLLVCLGYLGVLGARAGQGGLLSVADVLPLGVWFGSALLLVGILRVARFAGSGALLGGLLLLSGIGVLVRARMSGAVEGVGDMSLWIQPMGFAWLWLGWAASRRGRIASWRSLWPFAALLCPLVLGGLLVVGSRFRGALYGPGGMTPTELLKVLVPFALAGAFAHAEGEWRGRPLWRPPWGPLLALSLAWALLCALLVLQRDLGMVLLLSLTLLGILVRATGSLSWAGAAALAGGAGLWAASRLFAHGARRMEAWLDPFSDPTGAGWQVLQGLSGLYAGGLAGTGFGRGRPDRLPIAGSDFVYAVYGEETGYLGCLLLLLLYGVLFSAARRIVHAQKGAFAGLLAAGISAAFLAQVTVNIAGVVTLLPITGIPLPWISQGGSSYWVTSLQLGLLLGMSEPGGTKVTGRKAASRSSGGRSR